MDSFFASAGDLDNLLDELEEEETINKVAEVAKKKQEVKTSRPSYNGSKNKKEILPNKSVDTAIKNSGYSNTINNASSVINDETTPFSAGGKSLNKPQLQQTHNATAVSKTFGDFSTDSGMLIDIDAVPLKINNTSTHVEPLSNLDLLLHISDEPNQFTNVPVAFDTTPNSTPLLKPENNILQVELNHLLPGLNDQKISEETFVNKPTLNLTNDTNTKQNLPVRNNSDSNNSKSSHDLNDYPVLPINNTADFTAISIEPKPNEPLSSTSDLGVIVKNNDSLSPSLADGFNSDISVDNLVLNDHLNNAETAKAELQNAELLLQHVDHAVLLLPAKEETTAVDTNISEVPLEIDTSVEHQSSNGESTSQVVGFSDNVEISDQELNQFLSNDEILSQILSRDTELNTSCSSNSSTSSSSGVADLNEERNFESAQDAAAAEEVVDSQNSSFEVLHQSYKINPSNQIAIAIANKNTKDGGEHSETHIQDKPDLSQTESISPDDIQVMPFETDEEVAVHALGQPRQLVTGNSHYSQRIATAEPDVPQSHRAGRNRSVRTRSRPKLGDVKPAWLPDAEAPQCFQCQAKFTFTRRRHHCRACGKIFCNNCCYSKLVLKYTESNKEERVCGMCYTLITQASLQEQHQGVSNQPVEQEVQTPHPAGATSSNPTPESILTQNTPQSTSTVVRPKVTTAIAAPKSVRFADGTRPDHPQETPLTPPMPSRGPRHKKMRSCGAGENSIPAVILSKRNEKPYEVEENPDLNYVSSILSSEGPDPIEFLINPNLILKVRFIMCGSRQCWCFWTAGMSSVGQNEIAILFEREGLGDVKLPKDIFIIFRNLFERARRGKVINNYELVSGAALGFDKDQTWCGSKQNAGLLFVQPTYQYFCGFYPNDPDRDPAVEHKKYFSVLFGLLVHKTEAPWAALVPKRLLLRLGAETNQYPCPLFSMRQRNAVFEEIGHTILGILCDFTHFKYKIMTVPGINIIVDSMGKVSLHVPCNRFSDVIKIINSSTNESVFAVASGAIPPPSDKKTEDVDEEEETIQTDSHLVCIQDTKSLKYRTELLTMKNYVPKNTGAAFIVFNGSMHSEAQNFIKATIIEDGVMVQLMPERMAEFITSLKAMEDFKITNSSYSPDSNVDPVQSVEIKWIKDDKSFNIGLHSPIDFLSFEGIIGFNVQGRSEQKGQKNVIRWNQVFFISNSGDAIDTSRLAEKIANSVFLALTPLLHELVNNDQINLAIRVTIHPDDVSYMAGSRGNPLAPECMNALDNELVATIHNAASSLNAESDAIVLELLFSVLNIRFSYYNTSMDM